ncbi:MAG: hypothetical protein BAJATHORv1_10187 [Candidatus Thorarchaeota archaeon]|nr:MAG: hypothetical protein BAJATHORv1_10187 [Candidatus Thorarchaeota archaeon]
MSPASERKGQRFLFKITLLGPDEDLLEEVVRIFNKDLVSVDGISIGSIERESHGADVRAVFMFSKHSALDILLTMTYTGAHGAMVVLEKTDPDLEAKYKNKVKEKIGSVPCRLLILDEPLDDDERKRIISAFEGLVEELLTTRGL